MVTKKDYEDAIKKIREAFYSSICDEWALEQIAVNLDFLSSLINEHFEEKQETNFEHYFEHLSKLNMGDFALINGRVTKCSVTQCSECDFNGDCIERKFKWLKQPHEKPIYKLTQLEYDLISAYITYHSNRNFCDCRQLIELKDKGHFKNVDKDVLIKDILSNYEVVKDEKC